MDNRNLKPWLIIGVAIVIVAIGYPFYFNWWDHKNCRESGGTWQESSDSCVEPANADIPNTEKSLHSPGDDKPRE